ncbi:MAG: MFS transporter [Alphaproteobacteria bacterium]|nr:MFS transporter [Alphaproteobacteria bacterium]MBV9694147.1 MFS transporter [Alphaproteobacteria bacterium]
MRPLDVSQGLAARQAALAILSDVLRKRRPLEAVLAHCDGLEVRDAGFARAIASQTLRHFGQLDALIRDFVPKTPQPHKAGPTLEILLMGAAELLFLDVAPHATVDAANKLAQSDVRALHFKPLINAVLRRVAREGRGIVAGQDAPRCNTPDWLWARWVAAYGEETTRAIAATHAAVPPLDIVWKTAPADALFATVQRLPQQRVENIAGFAEGAFWVQDAAATMPVHLLGDVDGRRVIDLCAAPGGKTAQLAASGAIVTAVDRDGARLTRLAENLGRLQLRAEMLEGDVRDVQLAPAPFVLLDAPCTATGTIRRHPELPWIKSASDITSVAGASAELLDSAAALTAADGLLVFSVCSLEPEEGPEQIESFLAQHPEFVRAPLNPEDVFGHAEFIDPQGDLRTLPCHLAEQGGMDGFYAARLRRRS